MKLKITALILLGAILLTGCGFWGVRGSGKVVDETRSIRDFSSLDASGAYTIKIIVGENASLKISAEENLLKYIRTEVRGNTLVIDSKKNISPRKEIKIYVTTPYLNSIDCSGANTIYAKGINTDQFEVDLSGAGSIDLEGTAKYVNAGISGAGHIDAKNLKAKKIYISVSGAASAKVYASEYLDASVSGVGSIDYYGNPEKTKTDISGVGSINRK